MLGIWLFLFLFFQGLHSSKCAPSGEMLCSRPDLLGLSLCPGARQPTLAWTPIRNVCPLCSALSQGIRFHMTLTQ